MSELQILQRPINATAEEFKRWAREALIGSTVIVIPERDVYGDIVIIVNGEQKICDTGIKLLNTIIKSLRTYNPEIGEGLSQTLSALSIVPPSS